MEGQLRAISELCLRLLHQDIVSIRSCGIMSDTYFIDMGFRDPTLHDYMTNKPTAFEVIPQPVNCWEIATNIAAGLYFIHSNKLAHRDLEPNNGRPVAFLSLM